MKTNNLFYILIIGIGGLLALGGFLTSYISYSSKAEDWMYIGLSIIELAGFFMLLLHGTFIKRKYFRISKGIMAVVIIGVLFAIMRWPYGKLILVTGLIGIVITYLFSFLSKPVKNRLDIIKLAWVIVAFTNSILVYLHMIGSQYQILPSVFMWLAIIEYIRTEKKRGRLFT